MGRARTARLSEVVEKVQALVQSGSKACGISAKVWSQHVIDEILCMVSGVGARVADGEVASRLKVCVEAAVGTGKVVDWWVEDHLSKHVVVKGILEENWATCGWVGVRWDNPEVA